MSIDTGPERIDGGRQRRRTVVRLTPAAKPGQAGELPIRSPSEGSPDRSQPRERNGSSFPKEDGPETARGLSVRPTWLRRLGDYALALLFVAVAALVRGEMGEVLSPTPFLVFYLAWVAAAAFGGLGPGLLATLASWLCVDFFFDATPWHTAFFHDPGDAGRLMVLIAGGLAVSVVGERARRARIRQRRQTEELADAHAALQESEEKHRLVADNTYDWEFWLDPEDRFLYTSPSCERITGYAAPEFMNHPGLLQEIIHPEDLPAFLQHEHEAPASHRGDIEFRIMAKDGQTRWIHHVCQAIYDKEGGYAGSRGSNRDITERKRAEEALRESEFHLAQAQQITHLGSWSWDLAADRLYWSDETYRLYGLQPGESVPRHEDFLGFVHPEDRPRVEQGVRETLARGGPCQLDFRIVQRGGQERYVHCEAQVTLDREGHPVKAEGALQDITERKRAEEALRASQENLALAQEIAHLGNWSWDIRTNQQEWSDESFRIFGFEPGECRPDYDMYLGLLHPEDRGRLLARLGDVLERNTLFDIDYRIIRRDGSVRYIHSEGQIVRDDEGQPLRIFGTNQDITERKRAEEALRASEEKYRFLVENSEDITGTIDLRGKCTFVSANVEKMIGYRADEVIGKTLWDFLAPECHDLVKENLRRRLRGEDVRPYELLVVGQDGRRIPFEVVMAPVVDDGGNIVGVQGVFRDITERKRAEEALAESRKRYRGLVEKINDWVWEIDADGVYTYASPRVQELLGYAPEEIVGKTPFDLMPPAEARRVRSAFEPIRLGRKPLELLENTLVRKDGRLVTVETSGMPVLAEDGTFRGYTGVDRDVTSRKQAEEALRESEEKFRLLAETSPAAILIYQEGKYVYVNPAAESISGYRYAEFLQQAPGDILHPDDRQQVKKLAARREQGHEAPIRHEVRMITKDGRERWMDQSSVSILYGNKPAGLVVAFDITERKQAEEALRKSEEKFAKAFRSSPIAIAVTRLSDGRILDANEAMLKLLHFTADEVIGHTTRDLDIWVDLNDRAQFTQRVSTAGSVRDLEYRLRTKDGAIVTIHLSAELLEVGGEPCMLSTLVDVTERERAAEALRQAKAFTDKLLNAPRDTVFLFEPATGKPIRWNQRFAEVSGYDDEEIAGMKAPDDFYDEDDLQKAGEAIAKILAEGQGVVELSLVTKRGMPIPFEYAATVVETEDGKTLLLSVGRDITERKRAEEALRESEERFRIMADGSPNPIWVTNAAGERIFANKQYLEYFGISEREMEGGEWKPFLHPDDAPTYVNSFLSSLKEHRPFSAEARVRRADGQWRWIESHAEPRLSMEGEFLGFVGITQDITQRKQAEEALREWNATLESKVAQRTEEVEHRAWQLQKLTLELTGAEERERKRLAEILHDDLQQVLTAAKFQVGLLSSRVKNNAESQEIAGQARDLLADAIAKSRSLSHELSAPALSQTDLCEAFEWLAEQMQKKHGLVVHLDACEPIEVVSEPLRVLLYKVTQELLFNVIKHAGVHEAKLRLRRRRGRIRLSVSDKGRGFDPKEPGRNLGFGLLSIRERVGCLGGRLKIRSAPGKGSIFLVTVPDAEGPP